MRISCIRTCCCRIPEEDEEDEKDCVILEEQYIVSFSADASTPAKVPFTSSLSESKEAIVRQKYLEVTTSQEYLKDPVACVQNLISATNAKTKGEKHLFPDDDVIKMLKNELNL